MRHSPLKRRTPLKAKGGHRATHRPDKVRRVFVRRHPCILADHPEHTCSYPVRACHVRHGARHADPGNLWPGCDNAHTLGPGAHHTLGTDGFNARWGVDLQQIADEYERRFQDLFGVAA